MAVFHPYPVRCACGAELVVNLADSINVKRTPASRGWILDGILHRATCHLCGSTFTVEKPFYYTDLGRNTLFKVLPRKERHTWKAASDELDRASKFVPKGGNDRTLRVVFGMDELREKLVAQDLSIDDRELELLKVLLISEHPFLVRTPRLRLALTGSSGSALEFQASFEHNPRRFRVELPRRIADGLADDSGVLREWSKRSLKADAFDLPDHWVNMWRWSPQPGALEELRAATENVEAGKDIDVQGPAFSRMVANLPSASHLPGWAKKDLRTLFEYVKGKGLQNLQDVLFEARFGIKLEDDWSDNDDTEDIDTLWKLLKDLPDSNVEGNTRINELKLNEGEGGGWYSPTTYDIAIGSDELGRKERFENVVRHEVGHAVHEMNSDLVDRWLADKFGWRTFGVSDREIDDWVGLMGGWGNITTVQQREVRRALSAALGSGSSWNPGPSPQFPSNHPWYKASFAPRLAFEKTGAHWYRNYKRWHRVGGKAFFLNYWYRTFVVVDVSTLDLVAKMPDVYASMSHFEFFAELYALFHDLDDPRRSSIPGDVSDWLTANLGGVEPDAPMPAPPRQKRVWETVTRPGPKGKKR